MSRESISIKKILTKFSVILIFLVMFTRWYIIKATNGTISTIIILLFANILIFLGFNLNDKINQENFKFFLLIVAMFIPSLYNNAYLYENKYLLFYYILICSYSVLFNLHNDKKSNLRLLLNVIEIYAIISCIVTWVSLVFPNIYIQKFIPILPESEQENVKTLFLYNSARPGLTDHYSRNAFLIVIAILNVLDKILNQKRKNVINYSLMLFFIVTMMMIGKRGHIIFLILSCVISYFIVNNIKLKNIAKFSAIAIFAIIFVLVVIKFVPGADTIIDRFEKSSYSDLSSGRIDLYKEVYNLYKKNNKPIGWGQFSKYTNYLYAGVHNDYIQIFCETGILGIFLIIGSNIIMLCKVARLARKDKKYYIILTYNIFYMLYSLTGIPHYDFEVYTLYFLLNSIIY